MPAGSSYVVVLLLEAKDKNVAQVLGQTEDRVEDLGETAENVGQRLQTALAGAAIAMTFGRVIPLVDTAIGKFNELRASQVGLKSIVDYTGESWERANEALKAYTSDGLIPVSQASGALKNLLLRGFGLDRSIELMYRLKDAAAYGRQGTLSLGDAVQSASEGLKNMNPILVDNAGVTKNMSVMYKEYAKSLGTTAAKLTDAQKIEAEYLGIMAETEAMRGNAIQLTDELSGKMAAQEAKVRTLYEAIGGALEPAYAQLYDVLGPLTDQVTAFAEANPTATATLLGGAGLVAAVGALTAALVLLGGPGAILVGVAAGVVALTGFIGHLIDRKRHAVERTVELAEAAGEEADRVRDLTTEYETLAGKPGLSADEHRRLQEVMQALAETVPEAIEALSAEGKVLDLNLDALQDYIEAQEIIKAHRIAELAELVNLYRSRKETAAATLEEEVAAYRAAKAFDEYRASLERTDEEMLGVGVATAHSEADLEDLYQRVLTAAKEFTDLGVQLNTAEAALNHLTGAGTEAEEVLDDAGDEVNELADGAARAAREVGELVKRAAELDSPFWDVGDEPEEVRRLTAEIEAYYDTIEQRQREAALAFRRSFAGQLAEVGRDWVSWGDDAAAIITDTGDLFAQTAGAIASGDEDLVEKLKEDWEGWFQWFIQRVTEIIVRWFLGQVLNSLGLGSAGPDVSQDIIGTVPGTLGAQHGGKLVGPRPGVDRVPMLGMVGEGWLDVDLTRRLERYLGGAESIERTPPGDVVDVFPADRGGAGYGVEHLHLHALDTMTLRSAIRTGKFGRELELARVRGKLPRWAA